MGFLDTNRLLGEELDCSVIQTTSCSFLLIDLRHLRFFGVTVACPNAQQREQTNAQCAISRALMAPRASALGGMHR